MVLGYPRSGTHWVMNIISHFCGTFSKDFVHSHELFRNGIRFNKAVYIKRHIGGIIDSTMRVTGCYEERLNTLDYWNCGDVMVHISSWQNIPNVLVVEYEELLKMPVKGFSKVLSWFGLEFTNQALKEAIIHYSVAKVQQRNEEPTPVGCWRGDNSWRQRLSKEFVNDLDLYWSGCK